MDKLLEYSVFDRAGNDYRVALWCAPELGGERVITTLPPPPMPGDRAIILACTDDDREAAAQWLNRIAAVELWLDRAVKNT